MRRSIWLAASLLCLTLPTSALGQPKITDVAPRGLVPGEPTDVTIRGENLADPLRVWTSFPAEVEVLPSDEDAPKTRRCRVKVAKHASLGVGGMMAASPQGATSVQFVLIDDLPTAVDGGKNHTPARAQAIQLPTAIDATFDGSQSDFYGFTAAAGQTISCEVYAMRLGANADPVLRLLNESGQELEMVDDDVSLGSDCRFQHQFQESGRYLLEVRDNRYRKGGKCRIRIGDFPLVSVPFPLGGRLGSIASFRFSGPAADKALPVLVRVPPQAANGRFNLAARYTAEGAAGITVAAASQLPERVEVEPNDVLEDATPITLPCAINGLLDRRAEKDWYSFPALKDTTYRFRSVCQELGAPTRLMMRLHDEKGSVLAETSLKDLKQPVLRHRFSASGQYHLSVEDLLRRHGPEFAYRVEATDEVGFSLAVKKDAGFAFNPSSAGGAFSLKVQVERSGYDGPIRLELTPDGKDCPLELLNAEIPAKAKEHSLIAMVTERSKPGQLVAVRLTGSAVVDGELIRAVVSTSLVVRDRWPQMTLPPGWLDGTFAVATGARSEPFFDFTIESQAEPSDAETPTVEWLGQVQRKDEAFKGDVSVVVRRLPEGASYTVQRVKDTDDYKITVSGIDQSSAAGQVELVAYGNLAGRGQVVKRLVSSELIEPSVD